MALRLYRWRDPPVIGAALLALASGFGQFGAVAALGSVAKTFGHVHTGASFADEAGLSGTTLGIGLAVIRAASLGGLVLAGLADRYGRRSVLFVTCAVGLALTAAAAGSPGYWWFVAIFALGRPALSATNGLAQVEAVELTSSQERTKAVAFIAAGYSVGAGIAAELHGLAGTTLGFRGLFALALVPLVLLVPLRRLVVEPERFMHVASAETRPVVGPVGRAFRGRLALVALVTFGVAVVTGPADSLVFVYAQNVLRVPGVLTAAMVVGAGVTGLAGLLVGRWLADTWGRRPAVALGFVAMAGFGVLIYSGTRWGLLAGYVAEVGAAAVLAPGGGALANELFPTAVRASVAGWMIAAAVAGAVVGLVAFGMAADVHGTANHAGFAAAVTFLPAIVFTAGLLFLPETVGHEPEELWPEAPA